MKRIIATAAIAASIIGATATVASAGEITGNGKLTPIKSRQTVEGVPGTAKSICSFSGRNDGYFDGTETARNQSWGYDIASQGGGALVNELKGFFGPGVACRGNATPPPEG